ncbi:PepSY domain-containing protein [bacterium]|nr:PepSY domain-containing protein [bacterium]
MKNTKKIHAWVGAIVSVFVLYLSVTGVLLNHPSTLKDGTLSDDPMNQHPHQILSTSKQDLFVATKDRLYIKFLSNSKFETVFFPFSSKHIVSMLESQNRVYIALQTGMLLSSKFPYKTWRRESLPAINQFFSIKASEGVLWISTDKGIYTRSGKQWEQRYKNTSKMTLYDWVKALHTGYYPFQSLKTIHSMATIGLIGLVITGLILFFRLYFKRNIKR